VLDGQDSQVRRFLGTKSGTGCTIEFVSSSVPKYLTAIGGIGVVVGVAWGFVDVGTGFEYSFLSNNAGFFLLMQRLVSGALGREEARSRGKARAGALRIQGIELSRPTAWVLNRILLVLCPR